MKRLLSLLLTAVLMVAINAIIYLVVGVLFWSPRFGFGETLFTIMVVATIVEIIGAIVYFLLLRE